MAKYRIVRKAGTANNPTSPHMIQQKVLGLFWYTRAGRSLDWSLSDCEALLEDILEERARVAKLKKKYPKNVVVKEYHG